MQIKTTMPHAAEELQPADLIKEITQAIDGASDELRAVSLEVSVQVSPAQIQII
jgi:hypothetical protein